jgi:hypothetical protein
MPRSDEFDDRRDDGDDRRDDRPRRRDDGPPPKKKGCGPIVIGLLVVSILVCCGGCGLFGWWSYGVVMGGQKYADETVAKIGSGDYAGAYAAMDSVYKGKNTLEAFEKEAKKSKLNDISAIQWTGFASSNRVFTYTGTASLKSGGSMPITVRAEIQDNLKSWFIIDFVTTPPSQPGPAPKDEEKTKPKDKDNKPKPKEEEDDK